MCCCVDDICRTIVCQPLRSGGFIAKLTDAEAVTREVVGEFMGKDQDQGIWRYFRNHWHSWFPNLGSRANFAKQSTAKDEKYYGFEGHVLVNFDGIICGYNWVSANIDERDVLPNRVVGLRGLLIGGKGYIRSNLKQELAEQGIDLQTPLRKNMQD